MITRLFDFVAKRVAEDPNGVMLAGKENGAYRTYSNTVSYTHLDVYKRQL